jgi:tRNA (guanosine-2'-O-)-methyltransferase
MARAPKRAGPRPVGAPVAETLVLGPRREKIEEVVRHRTRSLVVVLDRIEDPFNMAAVLRTCEAFGIQEVHVVEHPEVRFSPNERVTQGCDKWLELHRWESFAAAREALHGRGFEVWVSAAQPGATSLWELSFPGKRALVFGNERHGVSDEALALADGTFWIPMRGFTRSLNVSAAVAATLGRALDWRAQPGNEAGALSSEEARALRERFHALSVKQRGRIWRPGKR